MANKRRDDFLAKTKLQIAKRAAWLCSCPTCRVPTVGATADGQGEINIGTAAHICAAALGGPRYDTAMSATERSSAQNGIWLCRDHGKAVDSDEKEFTIQRLREWKKQAEEDSWRRVLRNEAPSGLVPQRQDKLHTRLRLAAAADLAVFRRTAKWPRTSVALTLKVDGYDKPATTRALARAARTLDDLILIAPPGMGKTTTLFQIADSILASDSGIPVIIPLGDWATENIALLDSVLKRPSFRNASETDFRTAASEAGVVLLLDGWNELDASSRERARVQIEMLKAELPELCLVLSTRMQMLDIPFSGTYVELMPLNDEQQMEIAIATRGNAGATIVDQAWHTAGVRELVSIPLYLIGLLSLPDDAPFPTTKEEVLRQFVAVQEKDARRVGALRNVTKGFQRDYLTSLAVFATRTANTAITDSNARRALSETATLLCEDGQISAKPEPDTLIEVLVSNHVLMRAGDTASISFQHQQFQEWYASQRVEQLIIQSEAGLETLKADIFNLPTWEEAILFAVERLARSEISGKTACGAAILAAFEVDPMLAAEMIYRTTEDVWVSIASTIEGRLRRWHAPGECDRALRFMMNSGRPEFIDFVWPLISHKDHQVSFKALRNCRRFRPSLLGPDAVKRIQALPQEPRTALLNEIAHHGEIEGLDLATAIARDDPDPEVRASVVAALAFRRADRHLAAVLKEAKPETFDLIVRRNLIDDIGDESIRQEIGAARERQDRDEISAFDRLRTIVFASDAKDRSTDLIGIVSEIKIKNRQSAVGQLVYQARDRYPRALAEGLLARVRAGHTLFYGAYDILASVRFDLEDDELLQLALAEDRTREDRAEAAASVLGPRAALEMINALLAASTRLHEANGDSDKGAVEHYRKLQTRIAHLPAASLLGAIQVRSANVNVEQIAQLAELLSLHPDVKFDSLRQYSAESLAEVRALVENWAGRMLVPGGAERWQMARLATLASNVPDTSLLPLLKRLLDDNLRRYRAAREEAEATGRRQCNAVDEARQPMTHEYYRAFLAIDAPETAALMREYLDDLYFGELAARVLASQWESANEPTRDKQSLGSVDFGYVREKRSAHIADPAATSEEAEAIFTAIVPLIASGATNAQQNLAVSLGTVAVRLPHGQHATTIEKLLALSSRRERPQLLLNLILSGEEIDIKLVTDGIAETFDAAKMEPWILTQSEGYELREWLRLLPFTNCPAEAHEVVRRMPAAQRQPGLFEEMVDCLTTSPSEGNEEVLFRLAEEEPRFYQNLRWRAAALKFGTASAALRLTKLTIEGMLDGRPFNHWSRSSELAALIAQFPEVRSHVYDLLRDEPVSQPLVLLAQAVAESPDVEGVLLLTDFERKQNQSLLGWRSIEKVVTEHVPAENNTGAYEVVSVSASELRKKLLAKTVDGGPSDVAARCLNIIDSIRDERGLPLSEPRHPDLPSKRLWPIIRQDPSISSDG